MSDYTKTLEAQNEELQKRLSEHERIKEHRDNYCSKKCEVLFTFLPLDTEERRIFETGVVIPGQYVMHEVNAMQEVDYRYITKKLKQIENVYQISMITFHMYKNGRWVWTIDVRFVEDNLWEVYVLAYNATKARVTEVKPTKQSLKHFLEKLHKMENSIFL